MKKFSTLFASIVLILSLHLYLFLQGCNEKKDNEIKSQEEQSDSPEVKTPAANNEKNFFNLVYKLDKGKSFRYRLITSQIENMQVQNKDTAIHSNMVQQETFLMNFQVDGVDENNAAELTCRITSIKSETDLNGTKFKYQTGQAAGEKELKNYARFESFMGNPFGLKISKYGDIVEINRIEKIINSFISINEMQDTIKQATKEQLRRDLTEAMLKPLLLQIFRKFPEEKMGKDSVWTIPQQPMPLTPMILKNTLIFRIAGIEKTDRDTAVVIEGEMKTEISGQQSMTNQGVQYFFDKPRTNASGRIYFSLSKGIIQRSNTSTLLEHSFRSEASTPQGVLSQTNRRRIENSMQVESLN